MHASTATVRITVEGKMFTGVLDDSAASRDMTAQRHSHRKLRNFHDVEEAGKLPRALSTEGKPAGADPEDYDICDHAPRQDHVPCDVHRGYYDGIVLLGQLKRGAERLARMPCEVQVEVDRAKG